MKTMERINYRKLIKCLLLAFFLTIRFTNLYAQSKKDTSRQTTITITDYAPSPDPDTTMKGLYGHPDMMARFPGDIKKYFSDSIRYPEDAKEKKIQGIVYLDVVIERDGSVSSINVLRSPSNSLSIEAKRVVSTMPKWIPGEQKGKVVRVQSLVPIHFNLPPASGGAMKQ